MMATEKVFSTIYIATTSHLINPYCSLKTSLHYYYGVDMRNGHAKYTWISCGKHIDIAVTCCINEGKIIGHWMNVNWWSWALGMRLFESCLRLAYLHKACGSIQMKEGDDGIGWCWNDTLQDRGWYAIVIEAPKHGCFPGRFVVWKPTWTTDNMTTTTIFCFHILVTKIRYWAWHNITHTHTTRRQHVCITVSCYQWVNQLLSPARFRSRAKNALADSALRCEEGWA